MVFIILVCNNQLLEWIENELIWVLGLIPGFSSVLPRLIAKLHKMKEKYLAPVPTTSNIKVWKIVLLARLAVVAYKYRNYMSELSGIPMVIIAVITNRGEWKSRTVDCPRIAISSCDWVLSSSPPLIYCSSYF